MNVKRGWYSSNGSSDEWAQSCLEYARRAQRRDPRGQGEIMLRRWARGLITLVGNHPSSSPLSSSIVFIRTTAYFSCRLEPPLVMKTFSSVKFGSKCFWSFRIHNRRRHFMNLCIRRLPQRTSTSSTKNSGTWCEQPVIHPRPHFNLIPYFFSTAQTRNRDTQSSPGSFYSGVLGLIPWVKASTTTQWRGTPAYRRSAVTTLAAAENTRQFTNLRSTSTSSQLDNFLLSLSLRRDL